MISGIFMKVLVSAAVLLSAAWVAIAMSPSLSGAMSMIRRMWASSTAFERAVVTLFVCVLVYRGATKSIMSKTDHDPGIGIVAAEMAAGGAVTNLVPQSLISSFGHGTNIVGYAFSATNIAITAEQFAQKVWWRESNRMSWTNANDTASLPDGMQMAYSTSVNANTTTVYFVYGPTNRLEHASFYVGDDLPPVYVELEGGITLDSFQITSSKVTVTYTVDESALTGAAQVAFDRMWSGGEWTTIRTVEASAGRHVEEFPGFFVSRRSMWRVRLLVEVAQ